MSCINFFCSINTTDYHMSRSHYLSSIESSMRRVLRSFTSKGFYLYTARLQFESIKLLDYTLEKIFCYNQIGDQSHSNTWWVFFVAIKIKIFSIEIGHFVITAIFVIVTKLPFSMAKCLRCCLWIQHNWNKILLVYDSLRSTLDIFEHL